MTGPTTAPAPAPAPDRFTPCLAFTWRPENDGQSFHVTPGDHGGPTAWGVTLLAFQSWRRAHGQALPGAAELKAATRTELAAITRCNYWNAVGADRLPPGVDLLVYEFGFGSGPATSTKVMQRVLNDMGAELSVDGQAGPQTLAKAAEADRHTFAGRLGAAHANFYRSLDQPVFLRGWLRRNADRVALALRS